MPPSSLHAFLRQDFQIAGISIADHEVKYTNKFYHGVFDTADNLNITFPSNLSEPDAYDYTTQFGERLQKLITNVAQTVYSVSSSKLNLTSEVNQTTVNKLVYCYYKNTTCDFFKSILTPKQWEAYMQLLDMNLPKKRLSFYTGVNDNSISGKWISSMLLRYFTRNLDLEKLSEKECVNTSESVMDYVKTNKVTFRTITYVSNSSLCIVSSIYAASSVSPAFEKYDDGIITTDKFSAWSESSWIGNTFDMKMFMYTNDVLKIVTLVMGVVIFLISIGVTYAVNKYSNKWLDKSNAEQETEFFE